MATQITTIATRVSRRLSLGNHWLKVWAWRTAEESIQRAEAACVQVGDT